MPELPEVETIRLQLNRVLRGLRITGVEVLDRKSFVGEAREVRGLRVVGVERRGKMIIIRFSGEKSLLVHLKLTGQLIYREGDKGGGGDRGNGPELPNKFTRVIISFNNGGRACLPAGRLYFNDLRKFGWIKIVGDLGEVGEVREMGMEPLGKGFTVEYLGQVFGRTSRPVKLVLMDQAKIAGIGNIYANEALFEAGISPLKAAKELNNLEIEKLRESILKVLKEGIKYGGSSAADEAYVKPNGTPGSYQEHFRVYQREGRKCLRCGGIIKRVNLGGRGMFYCPRCQK